jgi:hypothetical protein
MFEENSAVSNIIVAGAEYVKQCLQMKETVAGFAYKKCCHLYK